MFTYSKNNNFITGTIHGEVFGINYNEETFKAMEALEVELMEAETPEEAKAITEKFKKLTEEDPKAQKTSEIHPDIFVSNEGNFYLKTGGKVTSMPMPKALVGRIKDSLDKGLDVSPILKFWIRFLRNHKLRNICTGKSSRKVFAAKVFNYVDMDFVSHEQVQKLVDEKGYTPEVAEQLCTVKQVKITKEGLLATYKVSKEITKRYRLNDKGEKETYDVYDCEVVGIDEITGLMKYADKKTLANESRVFEPAVMAKSGDEFYCGDTKGHIIRVGQTHRLEDWNFINTNDNQSCVKGLHIGGLDYIKGYQGGNTETHNVLVDPAHIGAVPDDHTGAIRCMQYFVLDAFGGVNGSLYHSSAYAAKTDIQWEEEKAEILKEYGEFKAEQEKELEEMKSI